jgi:hypothetical protein
MIIGLGNASLKYITTGILEPLGVIYSDALLDPDLSYKARSDISSSLSRFSGRSGETVAMSFSHANGFIKQCLLVLNYPPLYLCPT